MGFLGTVTLVKLHNDDEGNEQFDILIADPAKSAEKGYSWANRGPYSEARVREILSDVLADSGAGDDDIEELFKAARSIHNASNSVTVQPPKRPRCIYCGMDACTDVTPLTTPHATERVYECGYCHRRFVVVYVANQWIATK